MVEFPIDPVVAPLTPEAFRRQVKSLIDSYHAADTDFLAEVLQNSVDALEDRFAVGVPPEEMPTIELTLGDDALTIADNGPGLREDVLEKIARPNFTDKVEKRRRGHKGVGLSFAAWTSKSFHFATKRAGAGATVSGKLVGGADWINGAVADYPKVLEDPEFDPQFLKSHAAGTVFKFVLGSGNRVAQLAQRLNEIGLQALTRTLTAVGYAQLPDLTRDSYPAWIKTCLFTLKILDRQPMKIQLGYMYMHEFFGRDAFNLDNLASLSIEKQQKILHKKKCIYVSWKNDKILEFFKQSPDQQFLDLLKAQKVAIYAAFLDKAARFKELNDLLYGESAGPGRKRQILKPGVHFVTATMPAGEIVDIQLPFGGGNKDRLYVVFQMANAIPDLGRKTFGAEIVEAAQRVSERLSIDVLVPNRQLLIPFEIPHGPTQAEQVMAVEVLKNSAIMKGDLALARLGVLKEPGTEQDVVAIFHALLGAGLLRGYQILAVFGSSQKYDGVFKYSLPKEDGVLLGRTALGLPPESFGQKAAIEFPPSILEFKPLLHRLVVDFEEDNKTFEDITLAIAWDVGDANAFQGSSQYRLETASEAGPAKQFFGETHLLSTTGIAKKIHVILLKHVIDTIISEMT